MAKVNSKSGNGMAKVPKTDKRYWRDRVRKPKESNFYGVRIASHGERHYMALGTANRDQAAARAAKLFLRVKAEGWQKVLEEDRPTPAKKAAKVGDYIEKAEEVAQLEPRTINEYKKAFRRLVAEVKEIEGASRFDWRPKKDGSQSGYEKWRAKVDAVRLDQISAGEIQRWKMRKLAEAGSDPARQRATKNTVNSVIRNTQSIFGRKVLPYVAQELEIPDPHPFKDVEKFSRQSMRYLSKIDVEEVIRHAEGELATYREITETQIADYVESRRKAFANRKRKRKNGKPQQLSKSGEAGLAVEAERLHEEDQQSRREQFKILMLALFAGLRFNEIDKLLWRQVNFERAVVSIEATEFFRPKTQEAVGEVVIAPNLLALLRGWKAQASGEFVIEAKREVKHGAQWNAYRAETHHKALLRWLRDLEMNGDKPLARVQKPIHEMRKEAGSLMNQRYGIHAASVFLRHSNPATTAAHYLDVKQGATIGLDHLLTPQNVEPFPVEESA